MNSECLTVNVSAISDSMMLNLEYFDGGTVITTLRDNQLSAGGDGDCVGRSESVVLAEQVTYKASGERHLTYAVVVTISDDYGAFLVDAQPSRELELPWTAALATDLSHELAVTVEYLHINKDCTL